MIKHTQYLIIALVVLCASAVAAQNPKKNIPTQTGNPTPEQRRLRPITRPAVPMSAPLFDATPDYSPKSTLQTLPAQLSVTTDAKGRPIFWEGALPLQIGEQAGPEAQSVAYLDAIAPKGIARPMDEFVVRFVQQDELGQTHVRFQQVWNNIPVYGGELVVHINANNQPNRMNGRYFDTPSLNTAVPAWSAEQALQVVYQQYPDRKTDWSATDLAMIGNQAPFHAELIVYHIDNQQDKQHLAWHITGRPNLLQRIVYFIDATNGAILNQYDHTCKIDGGRCTHHHTDVEMGATHQPQHAPTFVDGPVNASGTDLLGVNRSFGAYQVGNQYLLEDASQPMFNAAQSQMPNDPVGAIITLDALNTSPEVQQSFNYDFVKSNSTTFNNTTAVSGHWNSIKSYQYFRTKFNRNSIDGTGGNIIAFVNVSEANGTSMENAFWNGAAMWYGNGGSTFRRLARGLDVGGHEMSHGVIEKTANLEYQGESGALNESFADIFGAMIDLGDWQIGEDVMQPNTHTCLRDMSNPHNGVSSNSPFWQPNHVNEQYNGSQDNGGVHINSGITNRAYYLFATASGVGTDKAEQVYYKALRDYLVKSSQFVDCRIAVIQAAQELYGNSVANAAASAFDQVGILGSAPSGNYLGQLQANPGEDLVLVVSDDYQNLDLALGNGQVLGAVYQDGVRSRPSVTDDGRQAVFVNENNDIVYVDFQYTQNEIIPTVDLLSTSPIWRNAVISKDGRYIAATTDFREPRIQIYDLNSPTGDSETFFLYNPTYTQGQATGEVSYADVMEFDYTGNFLMYDAYNELSNSQGNDLSYWDIGFMQFRDNGNFVDGGNAFISKLFNGIPAGVSIGNPTFSKNSPYVIAFDYADPDNNDYNILGSNIETGDYDAIVSTTTDYAWPNYDRLDQSIIYHVIGAANNNVRRQGVSSTKITAQGSSTAFVSSHILGVWFSNGVRSLSIDTDEAPLSDALKFSIAPNPTSSSLTLTFSVSSLEEVRIEVIDMWGRTIQTHQTTAVAGDNYADLNVADLAAGQYVARIITNGSMSARSFVKN
jgi:bacillolysin